MRVTRFLVILFTFFSTFQVYATHIRAADFSSVRISPTSYRITLAIYTDYENVDDGSGSIPLEVEVGLVSFNDLGNIQLTNIVSPPRTSIREIVSGETIENIYVFDYQFPSVNAVYRIGFFGELRNAGILNLGGNNSGNQSIFVEEFLFVDALDVENSSPRFTLPPIFRGATNRVFTYNPGGVDNDGDSLTYELIPPRGDGGQNIGSYVLPSDPSVAGTGGSFVIDPRTGQITWDAPLAPGEYNVAIRINEYRNGARIGYTIRDMQIVIEDSDNDPPILYVPKDTCVVANTTYTDRFSTFEPNGDNVDIDLVGILDLENASLQTTNLGNDSTVSQFSWTPGCNSIGQYPVFGLVNVVDDFPGLPLSASGTWEIKVDGRAPNLLSANLEQNGIRLNWQSYDCQKPRSIIEIYRFECDTNNVLRSSCLVGVPEEWGATKVGEVDVTTTTFLDDGSVAGLSTGIQYFYLVAVKFGSPNFGESYASNIVSSNFGKNLPLITEVSYDKNRLDAFVNVSWEHFDSFDSTTFVKPFTYKVISDGVTINQITVDFASSSSIELDTLSFNTNAPLKLELTDANDSGIGSLDFNVDKLDASGGDESLFLNWKNLNSWGYPDTLFTRIYLFEKGGDTLVVDSVQNGNLDYLALGLENGDSVCGYIEIPGAYCQDNRNLVYRNFTNTSCDLVQDREPPCVPDLGIDIINCSNPDEGNSLQWQVIDRVGPTSESVCNNADLAAFNLQVKPGDETAFRDLSQFEFDERNFKHQEGDQLYCYRIQAIDSVGNASVFSSEVCQDFCGSIIYPNVFTPNADGINDNLVPISTFEGLKNPLLSVFNRWGNLIFSTRDPENNPWTGILSSGRDASEGVYYIEIKAEKALGSPGEVVYKGWVQLLR